MCSAQCAVIDHYIIHFPNLVERYEKTFEHSWLEKKHVAQVLKCMEIEGTWSTVSEELLCEP
jgi:hypothetical protein